jgi:PTH1 family peptidyl-tRNA hydrolase
VRLLVGLGNPGPKYDKTRHNAGFVVLDMIAALHADGGERLPWEDATGKFEGMISRGKILGESCVLLKPLTFMNLSGRSVQKVLNFFKIEVEQMVVLHDDIDVPAGKVKARVGGGHGGNNGVRSIIETLGVNTFSRVKLGVGKPPPDQPETAQMEVRDWVLQRFSMDELRTLEKEMVPETLVRLRGLFLGQ